MSLIETPAVVLRGFAYGDTSRIAQLFTLTLGQVGVMAKGIRTRGGKGGHSLGVLASGTLSISHRPNRDLQSYRDFAVRDARPTLAASVPRFTGASALAEIVLRHSGEEPNPDLFTTLETGLDALVRASEARVVAVVLAEAWSLVAALGYMPRLDACVRCGRLLTDSEVGRFDHAHGGMTCARCAEGTTGPKVGPGAREQLRGLLGPGEPASLGPTRAHLRLLSDFITYHIAGGRPLHSLTMMQDWAVEDG